MRYVFVIVLALLSLSQSFADDQSANSSWPDTLISKISKLSLEEQTDSLIQDYLLYRDSMQWLQVKNLNDADMRLHLTVAHQSFLAFRATLDLIKAQGSKNGKVRKVRSEYQQVYWLSLFMTSGIFGIGIAGELASGGGYARALIAAKLAFVITGIHAWVVTKEWRREKRDRKELMDQALATEKKFDALSEELHGKARELHNALKSIGGKCDAKTLQALFLHS